MNNKISYDNIDISYHIENLDSFFSLFFPHLKNYEDHKNYLSKIEDEKVNQKIKENKNKIKENKNKSFFDKLFNFKKQNTNTKAIIQEKPKEVESKEKELYFDKEAYFTSFPAFYYIDFKLLDKHFKNFFSVTKNKNDFAYKEFSQTLEIEIKNIITKNNSYKSVLKNMSYFKLPEVMNNFKSDESIIYFFNYVNNKKFNQYERLGYYENLANYLISDIVFHKNHLFESCFTNFNFDFIKNNNLDCLINYMVKQNTIHLFLKYANLTKDRKIQIEKFIISKEISNL